MWLPETPEALDKELSCHLSSLPAALLPQPSPAMAVTTPLLLLLVLGATLHSTSANTCYSGLAEGAPEDCKDEGKTTIGSVGPAVEKTLIMITF